ncbi:MAG TPA: polymer-forming cytoskeletal protein [Patescibacteria group bacterium]|nr:polymer-forming cytoskeletal protein [Patescibacteria group bacterium]
MENFETSFGSVTETVVGPSVKIQGDLNSEGNIRIQGHVHGNVKTSESVFIEETAKITADIQAGNVICAGEITGNMKVAGKMIMQSPSHITGNLECGILQVEDGAVFNGEVSMGNQKKVQAEVEEE